MTEEELRKERRHDLFEKVFSYTYIGLMIFLLVSGIASFLFYDMIIGYFVFFAGFCLWGWWLELK